MPNTTIATGSSPPRKAALRAARRLAEGGFARNSIDLHPHPDGEGYDLTIHTRRENLNRARRLIHPTGILNTAQWAASGAVQTAKVHPVVLLGLGLVAGVGIYSLMPRSNRR